jgi:hypothetical protein
MTRLRTIGLALVVALAAIAVATASASPPSEFEASPLGGTIGGKATTTQVFTTNAGKTECTGATPKGEVKHTNTEVEVVKVAYTGCKALGQKTKITEAEFEFNAKTGEALVKNTITITVEEAGLGCTVKIGPAGNSKLSGMSYENTGKKMLAKAAVGGITFTTSGGFCGKGANNGTYAGTVETEINGGEGLINVK